MPKTAVDENDGPESGEDQVGPSRQIAGVQSIAESGFVKSGPEQNFRSGISVSDSGHNA